MCTWVKGCGQPHTSVTSGSEWVQCLFIHAACVLCAGSSILPKLIEDNRNLTVFGI